MAGVDLKSVRIALAFGRLFSLTSPRRGHLLLAQWERLLAGHGAERTPTRVQVTGLTARRPCSAGW